MRLSWLMGQFLSFHPGGVRTLAEQMQPLLQRQTGYLKAPHMQFNAAERLNPGPGILMCNSVQQKLSPALRFSAAGKA